MIAKTKREKNSYHFFLPDAQGSGNPVNTTLNKQTQKPQFIPFPILDFFSSWYSKNTSTNPPKGHSLPFLTRESQPSPSCSPPHQPHHHHHHLLLARPLHPSSNSPIHSSHSSA